MSITWTERDLSIVETLASKVRLLSRAQVARGWWSPSKRWEEHAATRMKHLTCAGLVLTFRINLHPMWALTGPAARWQPGDADPDPEAVAQALQGRWIAPAQPTMVYTASKLAANLFGCDAAGLPELTHRDHDHLLAEVFIHYLQADPGAAPRWVGEATRPKAGFRIKDPDAFLLDEAGEVCRVIESGGKYDAERVAAFHEHCAERDLPYELW